MTHVVIPHESPLPPINLYSYLSPPTAKAPTTMDLFDPSILAAAQAAPVLPIAQFSSPALGDDAWLAASKALDTDAPVNLPGMLRPFLAWQGAAYLFAKDSIARWGGCLLGDDMGLGKTQVLLALANDAIATHGGYAIVVVPTVAEAGYRSDLRASFPGLKLHVVKGRTVKALPAADIYMISDDSLTMKAWLTVEHEDAKGRKHLTASSFAQGAAIVLRDEIHRDKGNQSKPTGRAKVMLAIGEYMRSVLRPIVGATGTLLTNRPVEGYLPLMIIGGERLIQAITPGAKRASGFLWRYCAPVQQNFGGRKVTTFSGIDIEEAHRLHEYLRRTVYVRREKSDLGEGQLPHYGWIVTPLGLTDDAMRRYARVEKEFLKVIEEEKGPEAMWRADKAQAIVQMNMLWQEAGMAKVEAAVDYVKNLTDEGEQVVMFYYHADTYLALAKALVHQGISYTTINGQVTGDYRVEAVEEFQAGEVKVCLAQIKAAGMAVTLTAAPHAVFVQVPWSAGDLKQAADRILRVDDISRERAAAGGKVTWHVLQSAYEDGDLSFDAAMWSVLETKAKVCDAVNAGKEITMPEESVMYEALLAWVPNAKRHGGW